MTIQELVEATSLALTVPALLVCAGVVFKWRERAFAGMREVPRQAVSWFAIGVFLHFATSFVDNLYWGITWYAKTTDHPSWRTWFEYGAWSNIPFRQLGTGIAGYCHLKAAASFAGKGTKRIEAAIALALVAGIMGAVIIQ